MGTFLAPGPAVEASSGLDSDGAWTCMTFILPTPWEMVCIGATIFPLEPTEIQLSLLGPACCWHVAHSKPARHGVDRNTKGIAMRPSPGRRTPDDRHSSWQSRNIGMSPDPVGRN